MRTDFYPLAGRTVARWSARWCVMRASVLHWSTGRRRVRQLGRFALLLALGIGLVSASVNMDRMLLLASQRYGDSGASAVSAWRELLTQSAGLPEEIRLRRVNDFFNRRVRFDEDSAIWGQSDYWATPLETLGRSEGDCEDFAIAKYITLKLVGVSPDKLRLTYVKARIGGPQSTLVQAHMILSYYPAPDAEPLVLDNLVSDIRPASRRPDLTTIFGFNAAGMWVGGTRPRAASSTKLSKWQSVLVRMREEGIE